MKKRLSLIIFFLSPFIHGMNVDYQEELEKGIDTNNIQRVSNALDHGANIESRDNHGWTPLVLAAIGTDLTDIVKLLIKRGADVNAKDNEGKSVLNSAIFWNWDFDLNTISTLLSDPKIVVTSQDIELVDELIKLAKKDIYHYTPERKAQLSRHVEVRNLLIAHLKKQSQNQ